MYTCFLYILIQIFSSINKAFIIIVLFVSFIVQYVVIDTKKLQRLQRKFKRNKINNTSSLFSSEEIERVIGMNRSPLELNINKIKFHYQTLC